MEPSDRRKAIRLLMYMLDQVEDKPDETSQKLEKAIWAVAGLLEPYYNTRKPSQRNCSLCGEKVGPDCNHEIRPSGPKFANQRWPFCDNCWEFTQRIDPH